ncbi:MAG TPA: cytochrome c peroxidase [Planctomycetota bacterium]|nr:cytochrome c peroxidase [Planctomycetota bacterium]
MRSLRCGIAAILVISPLAIAGDRHYDPKVELGRRLFMDPTVSRGGKFSCASCHDPERGFSDPRRLSTDETGTSRRHSQPILDLVADQPLHWDGEFGSVRELLTARIAPPAEALQVAIGTRTRQFERAQAAGRGPNQPEFQRTISRLTPPYYGPVTPGRTPPISPLLRLDEDDRYGPAFSAVFGSSTATTERIIDAMHAYMLSIKSTENAYDRFVAGNPGALGPAARRGLALFTGKADCASCHTIGEEARFTDNAFHNTGVAFRDMRMEFGGGLNGDGGAGEMTFVSDDLGKFKTPSLRDVARRAPYMHNGAFATLEDVVDYYDKGGTANTRLDQHVRELSLTEDERADLVAFLNALTGDERPGLGPVPNRSRHARIKVVDLKGKAMKGLTVEIHAAGDRLEGGRAGPPQVEVTDSEGYVTFEFPAWTHVRLESAGHEIQYGWLIPDCVHQMTVTAAPLETVAFKVRPAEGAKLPEYLLAGAGESGKKKSYFEEVRTLPDRSVIYVARAHAGTGRVKLFGQEYEVDLTGGWAEPIDLRPEPQG